MTTFFPYRSIKLKSKKCSQLSSGRVLYSSCRKIVKQRTKNAICRRRGKGLHRYYIQTGKGPKVKTSVYCKY